MGVLDEYINGRESNAVDFTIADSLNPVNWTGLSKTIVGSFAAGLASNIIAIPRAVADAYESIFGGFTTFVSGDAPSVGGVSELNRVISGGYDGFQSGIVDVIFSPFINAISGVWRFNIQQFGLFALPVSIVLILVSLYFISVGAQKAFTVLMGGDAF